MTSLWSYSNEKQKKCLQKFAMKIYFNNNNERYRDLPLTTLPIVLHNDLANIGAGDDRYNRLKSTKNLYTLQHLQRTKGES